MRARDRTASDVIYGFAPVKPPPLTKVINFAAFSGDTPQFAG